MSIKAQLFGAFAFLTILFIAATGITWTETRDMQREAGLVDSSVNGLLNDQMALIRLTKEIQINVIQVQQWLTDISATRGRDGLNDGFDEAAEQARLFAENIAAARALAVARDLTGLVEKLDRTAENFGPYYSLGQQMANAYVAAGPAGGNPMMGQFDKGAARIQESLGELLAATADVVAASNETLSGSVHAISVGADRLSFVIMLVGGFGVLAILAIGAMANTRIVFALSRFTQTMLQVAQGALAIDIPYAKRRDEIGEMARAVTVFRDKMSENQALVAAQAKAQEQRLEAERQANEREQQSRLAQEAARKEVEDKAAADRRQAMLGLANGLEESVGSVISAVVSAVEQLRKSSDNLSRSASETTRQSDSVANASERASIDVETVAASAGKLDSSINDIARQASESADKARAAVEHAHKTQGRVNALVEAADRIGDVVGLIAQIASQTNLLALNATIEAARAGEAGKGFAVVVTEVKLLADQTAKATDEITRHVHAIRSETGEAVGAMEEISKAIAEIDEIGGRVRSAVEAQGVETGAIAHSAQQVSTGTAEVSRHIAGVSEAARLTDEASGQIGDAAEHLGTQSGALRAAVDRFLSEVRAA